MNWVFPISAWRTNVRDRRLHLVREPVNGPLVTAACGKLVNLDFATPGARRIRQCIACKRGFTVEAA